jgi:hypothetical protein
VFGFDIAKGELLFWTAGTVSSTAEEEKDDLRAPVCHMKRRSSQVWEAVRGLVAAASGRAGVVVGESGAGGMED